VELFVIQSWFAMVVTAGLFALKGFCLADAVTRPAETFVAADKNTKQLWVVILAVTFAAHVVWWNPMSLLNLLGTVAACVYLLDVRPAVRELTRRR
jgi:hypothetical protein